MHASLAHARDSEGRNLTAEWQSRSLFDRHVRKHSAEVGATSPEQYHQLALHTIEAGLRFTFRQTSRLRVGYYHARHRRLVILDDTEETIMSLLRCNENYLRRLPDSTYATERGPR